MAVDQSQVSMLAPRITLVDDIVTRGSQLIAAASLIKASFPESEVRALAALRARTGVEVSDIYDPVCGTIHYHGENNVQRTP